jgi:hypothetical protein
MHDPLLRIAYASRNAGVEGAAGLAEILAVSRRNNRRDGVTGALLFSENVFVQVLEGPGDAVAAVFERIQMDARHSDVVVLLSEGAAQRHFAAWDMAYAGEDEAARARFEEMDLGRLIAGAPTGQEMLALLRGALGRSEAMARGW